MTKLPAGTLSKVPEVTLGFWVIKVLATTLGETGGDAVTMSMDLGYVVGSFIFIGIFAAAVAAQILAKAFHSFLYWVTIVATTTSFNSSANIDTLKSCVDKMAQLSHILSGLFSVFLMHF